MSLDYANIENIMSEFNFSAAKMEFAVDFYFENKIQHFTKYQANELKEEQQKWKCYSYLFRAWTSQRQTFAPIFLLALR